MRRLVPVVTVAGLLLGGLVGVQSAVAATPRVLRAGGVLHVGDRLLSANGAYVARLEAGQLMVRTKAGRAVWSTPRRTAAKSLYLSRSGQLSLTRGSTRYWAAQTAGSGASDVLTLSNAGVLTLRSGSLTVWTNRYPNRCPRTSGKTFDVDVGAQVARMCSGGQQVRVTRVTTGASALGAGTPLGTWHVYAKVRNTTLHPAAGGAYPVKYWVPYDGAYGVHDSPWQDFPYGSALYKTRGSHGCTHVPAKAMSWFFSWVRVGTTVTLHG